MVNTTESRARKPAKRTPTKLCLHCGRVKQMSEYYANKDWDEQLGKDVWCRDCVNRCATKDEIREYFWENHREWNDRIWDIAQKKAEALASKNITYQKASDDRRKVILDRLTCQQIPTVMQNQYKFIDTTKDGKNLSYAEAKESGEVIESADPNVKIYNKEFNGNFTPSQLAYLRNYYDSLDADFELDTENLRDYARKLSKASMQADKAQDDYAAGRCDFSVVKDALGQFDMLSKSAQFAQCKRKPAESSDINSWGEMVQYLETHGHTMQKPVVFPPDDVDKTNAELGHIVRAIGFDD